MNVSSKMAHGGVTCLCAALLCAVPSAQTASPDRAAQLAAAVPLVFVVNHKNPVESLSLADLRGMLLGERSHWPDGARITIVMRQPHEPERDAVIRLVCRLEERVYTRTVLRAVFTGELRSTPKLLDTAVGVLKFVYNVPGAIGYVRASEVDNSVKIVRIADPPAGVAFGFTLQTR